MGVNPSTICYILNKEHDVMVILFCKNESLSRCAFGRNWPWCAVQKEELCLFNSDTTQTSMVGRSVL